MSTLQEARDRAAVLSSEIVSTGEEISSTDLPVTRGDLWGRVADAYLELAAIVREHGDEAVHGVAGLTRQTRLFQPYGRLVISVVNAEWAGGTGEQRDGTRVPEIEQSGDARRLLDEIAAGGLDGARVVAIQGKLAEVVRGLVESGRFASTLAG